MSFGLRGRIEGDRNARETATLEIARLVEDEHLELRPASVSAGPESAVYGTRIALHAVTAGVYDPGMKADAEGRDGIGNVVARWSAPPMSRLVTARLDVPASAERLSPIPDGLGEAGLRALSSLGIHSLWSHQADAVAAALRGEDVVMATPTASGKSLAFQLPVIDALARDPRATAIFLYPTKALEHDQMKGLRALIRGAGLDVTVATYDGDSPADRRRLARARARVILTNPDMLHMGILPHHASWAPFLAGLRYVVLDEMHGYRGVFGSHFANVARRLSRILGFHGARPAWIASSATIANPGELASALVGRPFSVVGASGAPSGPRILYFMTPALVDEASGVRGSYLHMAARAAADLVRAGLQTLVFAQSRRAVEIVLRYVRDDLAPGGLPPEAVQGYRGGYLPSLRRSIEDGLKQGATRCVIATNALELGVDVGSLDAVVLAGFPGTIASTWQRLGRAGRSHAPSIAVLVGSASPLDQFVIRHPEWLAETAPERGLVDPDNLEIVLPHLRCAVFELPFARDEGFGGLDPDAVAEVMTHFASEGLVHSGEGRHVWVADEYPGAGLSLRAIGGEPFVVLDSTLGQALGEVDARSTARTLHENAVYQHSGLPYLVEKLDLETRQAHVREIDPDYYTQPSVATTLTPIETLGSRSLPDAVLHLGEIRIVEKVTGFKKIRYGSHENLGYGEVDLPESVTETFAVWIAPTVSGIDLVCRALAGEDAGAASPLLASWVEEGMDGTGSLLRQVSSLRLMCDPRDLGAAVGMPGEAGAGDGSAMLPVLYVFDAHAGGVGIAERLFDEIGIHAHDALEVLDGCPCTAGCPSCVGPPDREGAPRKAAARAMLALIAEEVH